MDIGDLNFFLAVARAGGISRASKELLTVQSNISSRIRALEDELGVELFRRDARGVTLTNSGERLLPYAEQITQLVREVRQVVSDDRDPGGRLAIGSMETTAGSRLPGVLAAFGEECPRVDFTLVTDTTDALTTQVIEHRLDGAFVCGPVRHPDLVSEQVFIEQLVLVSGVRVADLDSVMTDGRRHRVSRLPGRLRLPGPPGAALRAARSAEPGCPRVRNSRGHPRVCGCGDGRDPAAAGRGDHVAVGGGLEGASPRAGRLARRNPVHSPHGLHHDPCHVAIPVPYSRVQPPGLPEIRGSLAGACAPTECC